MKLALQESENQTGKNKGRRTSSFNLERKIKREKKLYLLKKINGVFKMANLTEILEQMIEKIEASDGKWIQPFNNSFPQNYFSKTSYNGINVLNLWFIAEEKGYKTNNYLTYNQVKELGGHVLPGEKAHDVFFFKPVEIKDEQEDELKTIPMLKTFKVFNVDQTSLKIEKDNTPKPEIEEFIKSFPVEIKESLDGAFYVNSTDFIGMPNINKFESSDSYYSTLFHEMSHSTGHKSRLDRDMSGTFGSPEYAKEELIAETASVFLQVHFGISSEEQEMNNAAYMKGWLKPLKENPKMLWKIFSEAQKAFDYLTKN